VIAYREGTHPSELAVALKAQEALRMLRTVDRAWREVCRAWLEKEFSALIHPVNP